MNTAHDSVDNHGGGDMAVMDMCGVLSGDVDACSNPNLNGYIFPSDGVANALRIVQTLWQSSSPRLQYNPLAEFSACSISSAIFSYS
jgi:hypothetical protein